MSSICGGGGVMEDVIQQRCKSGVARVATRPLLEVGIIVGPVVGWMGQATAEP